jgi:GH3 auxin-responsive promoter
MSWTVRPNDYGAQFDAPITQYNDTHLGIPLRDRITDAFAYFPSEQYEYTGYGNSNSGDSGMEHFEDEDTKKTRKIAENIMGQIQGANLGPAETQFIYAELLDSQALMAINRLKKDITQPWTVMKNRHIDMIEARHGCKLVSVKSHLTKQEQKVKKRIERRIQRMYDLERGEHSEVCNLRSAHRLTDYTDYLKRIQDHRIEIPDRFDISSIEPYCMGDRYLPMKMMARYYRRVKRNKPTDVSDLIDLTCVALVDLHSVRSKTMFCLHICMPNRRDGITVIDQVSYSLNAVIHSPHLSQYLIYYGTTTNYSAYAIFDPLEATTYHLTYALLEPNMKRMVFYSPRHALSAIEILATRTDRIKELLLIAASISEAELLEHTHDETEDDDSKHSKSEKSEKSQKSQSKLDLLERLAHVFDVLYCIKKGFLNNRNIISECITDLWPKLNMLVCEIRGQDGLLLRNLQNTISAKHKGITVYSPFYAIPETLVGYNIECHPDNQYIIDPSQAYFEFLEVGDAYFRTDKVDLKVRSMRKLKKGSMYEMIVSSDHTDTIRQMTGDIVRICGYSESVPIITPICREIELIYSYCQGVNESDIISKIITPQDIDQIFIQSNLDVREYCYRKADTSYKFYLELHRFDYDVVADEESNYQRKRIEIVESVKKTRALYRLNRLLVPGYDSDSSPTKPNITDVEIRIVEPSTFTKIIKLRNINSIDPNTIRVCRRIVDELEINILKNAIVHQL